MFIELLLVISFVCRFKSRFSKVLVDTDSQAGYHIAAVTSNKDLLLYRRKANEKIILIYRLLQIVTAFYLRTLITLDSLK